MKHFKEQVLKVMVLILVLIIMVITKEVMAIQILVILVLASIMLNIKAFNLIIKEEEGVETGIAIVVLIISIIANHL